MIKIIKSIKVRLYLTDEQEILARKHIGCSRFIWNYMLAEQIKRKQSNKGYLSRFNMIKLLAVLKKQEKNKFLYEVSNATLQIACTDLNNAYIRFFNRIANFPKFKSKHKSKMSFPIRAEIKSFYFTKDFVQIEKLGHVKYKSSKPIPLGKRVVKFTNPRIFLVNGKWMLSFGMECENQTIHTEHKGRMGIDLGVKELATVSFNGKQILFHNINKSKRVRTLKHKLKHLQRKVSRKYRTNGNYEKTKAILKTEAQIKEIHYHLANIRLNYVHQTTHKLTELYPEVITIEDLNVSNMLKNRNLARIISEQGFYEFRRQMEYKCEAKGIKLQFADRFYPSSKTCSCCGYVKKDLKLNDRTYICSECGLKIDRDFNAALNLERYVG